MRYMLKLTSAKSFSSMLHVCMAGDREEHTSVCLCAHKPPVQTRTPRAAPYWGEGDRNWVAEEKSGRKMSQNSFLPLLSFELYECIVY